MSKKKKGPVKTVKAGFAIAKIYRTPTKGRESFTVTYYKGRERNRETFSDLKRAVAHAQSITNSLASGELDVLELRSDDRLAYIRARDAVKPYGLALDLSALEYAEANSNVSNQLLKLGRQKMQIDKKHLCRFYRTAGNKMCCVIRSALIAWRFCKIRLKLRTKWETHRAWFSGTTVSSLPGRMARGGSQSCPLGAMSFQCRRRPHPKAYLVGLARRVEHETFWLKNLDLPSLAESDHSAHLSPFCYLGSRPAPGMICASGAVLANSLAMAPPIQSAPENDLLNLKRGNYRG